MEKKQIIEIENMVHDMKSRKQVQLNRIEELSEYSKYRLQRKKSSNGTWHYTSVCRGEGSRLYLGSDNSDAVIAIKEYCYLNKSLKVINKNLKALEDSLAQMEETDYDHINSLLPDTYRNPKIQGLCSGNKKALQWKEKAEALKARHEIYKPEELTVTTDDGNKVRSKSEGMIYNYLLSAGVAFVYELPMKLRNGMVWPDFTLLSEQDYSTEIIIEHQGLMGNDYYRKRFGDKVYKYIQEGYVQGDNIFLTFDSADGGLDITPIKDIVRNKIKIY